SCWRKCITYGVGFEGSESLLQAQSIRLFLLPADPDVELSVPSPAPCLPACHRASRCDNNGLNL
ncbi:mCG1047212, partial [Mus musculus]